MSLHSKPRTTRCALLLLAAVVGLTREEQPCTIASELEEAVKGGSGYFNYTTELLFKGDDNQALIEVTEVLVRSQKHLMRYALCFFVGEPSICEAIGITSEELEASTEHLTAVNLPALHEAFDRAVAALSASPWGFVSGALGSLDRIIRMIEEKYVQLFLDLFGALPAFTAGNCISEASQAAILKVLQDSADLNRASYFRLMAALVLARERYHGDRVHNVAFQVGFDSTKKALVKHDLIRSHILSSIIEASNASSFLEVGVDEGSVSEALLEAHPHLQWYGVDCWADCKRCEEEGDAASTYGTDVGEPFDEDTALTEEALRARLARFGERATIVKGTSGEAAVDSRLPDRFDVVFVDACHSTAATEEDLKLWGPRAGVIAGHDYNMHYPGVPEAVHRTLPQGKKLILAADSMYWWEV